MASKFSNEKVSVILKQNQVNSRSETVGFKDMGVGHCIFGSSSESSL